MKRIFHNCKELEDARNGLYKKVVNEQTKLILLSRMVLCTPELFKKTALKMIDSWPCSAEHFLTDMSRNRQAWVGQASCCFFCGANEESVKIAWRGLKRTQQVKANKIADSVIAIFEKRLVDRLQSSLFGEFEK